MVGITLTEDPGNKMTVTAVACPEGTEKLFGYSRLSVSTIKKCAACCVVLPAIDYARGVAAAYQRSMEKLFVKEHAYSKAAPDLVAYVLKEHASGICVPHVVVKRHWILDMAEELAIHCQSPSSRPRLSTLLIGGPVKNNLQGCK